MKSQSGCHTSIYRVLYSALVYARAVASRESAIDHAEMLIRAKQSTIPRHGGSIYQKQILVGLSRPLGVCWRPRTTISVLRNSSGRETLHRGNFREEDTSAVLLQPLYSWLLYMLYSLPLLLYPQLRGDSLSEFFCPTPGTSGYMHRSQEDMIPCSQKFPQHAKVVTFGQESREGSNKIFDPWVYRLFPPANK